MRLLLDTHILLWWLDDSDELGQAARDAIADTRNWVYVSAVSIWEIVIKRALGKLDVPDDWPNAVAEEPFRRLPVTWEHALKVADLPDVHRDPFDRVLVAQATVDQLTLVTCDHYLSAYGVSLL